MTDLLAQLQSSLGPGYRIDRELGGGGMSRVYLAEELGLGRRVVVKVLPPEFAADSGAERFQRETRVVASLQHPNIVPVIVAGGDANLLWFTMPFVEGESLRARLEREGELPVAEAIRLWTEILDALAYAHGRGIVHRDIKPENVLLSGRHALVADFGIARALTSVVSGARATATGLAIGTPAYMSPEQAVGEPNVDARADIYSAALVMYEMLCGVGPFNERSPARLIVAHASQPVPGLRARRPQLSPELEALVLRCLEKRAADRPQSAEEVLRALALAPDATPGYSSGPRQASAAPDAPLAARTRDGRGRRRLLLVAAALVAVAGGVLGLNAWRARAAMPAAVPDSSRLATLLMPPVFDPADSLLVQGVVEMLEARLNANRRVAFVDVADAAAQPGLDERLVVGSSSRDSLLRWLRDLGTHAHVSLTLARAGGGYLLSANLRAVEPDSVLYAKQLSASSAADLPAITDELVSDLSASLGRAFGRIRRPSPDGLFFGIGPDAARTLQEASELFDRRDYAAAADKFRAVLRADSTLPQVWLTLFYALSNAGLSSDERYRALAAAYRHRGKIPVAAARRGMEFEYVRVTGDWDRALAMYQAQQRDGERTFENNYGLLLFNLRRFDEALQLYTRIRDTTGQMLTVADQNYVLALTDLGRFDEARAAVARMEQVHPRTHPTVMAARLNLARASRSADSVLAEARAQEPVQRGTSGRLGLLSAMRYAELGRGAIGLADDLQARRVALLRETGLDGEIYTATIGHVSEKAIILGDTPELRRELATAYDSAAFNALAPMDRPWFATAGAFARLGRVEEARSLIARAEAEIPQEFSRVFQVAMGNAKLELALADGDGQRALAAARLRDRGACVPCAWSAYARAWDAAGNADSALAYYDRYLDAKSTRVSDLDAGYRARFLLRSAELREARGDIAGALQRYRDFVEQWRNASPELQSRVREAEARIARLEARRG